MNNDNYGKGNGQYNREPYDGMNNDYYKRDYSNNDYVNNNYSNNFYGSDDNYTVPLQGKNNVDQNSYSNKSMWNDFDQGRFNNGNNYMNNYDNDYMNNEYNYYDDNYLYEDQYSIDYSNSSSNYKNNVYDYSGYNGSVYDTKYDPSLFAISNKLNENVKDEMMYTSLLNQPKENMNGYGNNMMQYDNKTVPLDMNEQNMGGYNSYSNNMLYDVNNSSVYGGIDSKSQFFHRDRAYDNKLIPTEDIVFDDAYVVKNQLFEDDEKLFSLNDILGFLICIVFAVILAFLITRFVAQLTMVSGKSMTHNLQDKDDLLLDKFTYKIRDPKRFEIVVFPVGNQEYYIKRIIGLPGEKVRVVARNDDTGEKSKIFINDKELTEDIYGFEDIILGKLGDRVDVTLKKDEYFVMGDNRNGSYDSRYQQLIDDSIGTLKKSDFIGRAIFRVSPISSFGPIDSNINNKIYHGDTALRNKYKVGQ